MSQERPAEEKPETCDVRVQDRIQGTATPVQSPTRLGPTRFSELAGEKLRDTGSDFIGSIWCWINGDPNRNLKNPVKRGKRKRIRTAKTAVGVIALVGFFIFVNWFMLSQLHEGRAWLRRGFSKNRNPKPNPKSNPDLSPSTKRVSVKVSASVQHVAKKKMGKPKKQYNGTYGRLLAYAAHALAEGQNKIEPKELWREPKDQALAWKPCADQRSWKPNDGKNGYIMVTANGGINQQRVAVCNIVVVARLLNATLVVPKFMFSDVWTDSSQFEDIYQVEHFIKYLSPDIRIVKNLPKELQSLDLEAIGSLVTDIDVMKEAKPGFYMKHILPLLLKNRVVHFFGFGNRLAFDPIPFQLQRLRCRCNFHALNFVPKIQETGAILVRRLRDSGSHLAPVDPYLVGPKYASFILDKKAGPLHKASKYLAVHLRFEIDMVAHSLCYFGGGDAEKTELSAYREKHFPTLANLTKTKKMPSPEDLRTEGLCPLSPEEAVLMLAGLGFNRKTRVFVAGANIYGGAKRLAALTSLYPNLVTKENVLSETELEPFKNHSSQLAVLDFIACAASDAFAMTDSGSQLSSLVSGYRIYYGAGKMPTIRPNKRRFSDILLKNNTIEWKVFEMGLNLNLSMYSLAKPLSQFLDEVSRIKDYDSKMSEIDGYVGKLEEERKKIDVFKRELPLCMLLLNEAIETLKEEASSSVVMASDGKLDVGEGAKVESDNKKNWMSSAQLWISNPNSQLQSPNRGGAFTSFNLPPPPPPPPPAPLSLRTPTSEILMDYNHQFSKPMQSLHSQKKEQRRRWSQELHRKFVDALHSLGGSQVATPKQIRDMMKVDGLTNDEVKSHLQKYRMHIRKHPAKTLSSSDQPVVLDKETQSLISLTRSDSPQSPLIDGGLFSNNGHSSEEAEDEEKSDGRSWRSVSNKKKQGLDLEL